jgi:hypothetical protein
LLWSYYHPVCNRNRQNHCISYPMPAYPQTTCLTQPLSSFSRSASHSSLHFITISSILTLSYPLRLFLDLLLFLSYNGFLQLYSPVQFKLFIGKSLLCLIPQLHRHLIRIVSLTYHNLQTVGLVISLVDVILTEFQCIDCRDLLASAGINNNRTLIFNYNQTSNCIKND